MKKQIALLVTFVLIITVMLNPFLAFSEAPFDILVPEFKAIKTNVEGATTYTGYEKGLEIIINSSFVDTSTATYEEEILRMATLGIVKQYGDRKYYPAKDASGYEALAVLVRLTGNEAAVIQRVYNQAGSSSSATSVNLLMNQEYLVQAQNQGIVLQNEIVNLNSPVTKEQLAVWVSRTLGIAPVFAQETVFSFSDWTSVNPVYRSILEGVVSAGIVPLKNDGSFGPKDSVKRGDLAYIAKQAMENNLGTLKITMGYGLVIGSKTETVYEDGNTIKRNTLTVKNTDGTVTTLIAEDHSKGNKKYDYVTYKDGIASNHKFLRIGDEVEYLLQNNKLMYAEAIDHNLILEKINANTLATEFSVFHYGTVSDIKTKNQIKEGKSVITEIYRIIDVTGDVFDILVDENLYTGIRDDIVTYKGNKIGGAKLLKVGDVMEYLVNPSREVVYIKVAPLESKILSGTVREIKAITDTAPASMVIYGYDDKVYEYPIAPYADLKINERYTDLPNFVYGMNVNVSIANGYILSASGESFSGDPGSIPQYGKMRMGTVDTVYKDSVRITLENGTNMFIKVAPDTVIMKDGKVISLTSLRVGNKVKAYFDDIYTEQSAKIEVEAPEILFESILKGKITKVDETRGEITIVGPDGRSNPQYIFNNTWTPMDDYALNLKMDTRTDIFIGNRKITVDELEKFYTNYIAYAVMEKSFGVSKIAKLSISSGRENLYSSTVKKTDLVQNKFEITSRENFNLTEGTIVVKDGLVVPNKSIKSSDTVLVVSETPRNASAENAMVVKVVTPFDSIFNSIRIGALEDVNPNNISMKNYSYYSNNELSRVDQNKSGYYKFYTDSVIQNVSDPKLNVSIRPADFYHMEYARIENVDPTYSYVQKGLQFKRYYAFLVVNEADGGILAMNLRHKGLVQGQNIDDNKYYEDDVAMELEETFRSAVLSRGVVVSNDTTWTRLEITDSHDWTELTDQWTANNTNIFIEYSDAIFIKDNAVIDINDVKEGNYLYAMRIKSSALVIFVED